jgi:hypothetical protein
MSGGSPDLFQNKEMTATMMNVISKQEGAREHGGWFAILTAWLRPTPVTVSAPRYEHGPDETVAKLRPCRTCGQDFPIVFGELRWLAKMGYPEFTHCRPCRVARRALRKEAA